MSRRQFIAAAVAALAIGAAGAGAVAYAAVPPGLAAALADKGRPAADVARDAARHPGEMLAWAGLRPGDKVADFIMGGGYFTRILSVAVGPKGHVYAYQPAEFVKFSANYGVQQKAVAAAYANVTPIDSPFAALALPDHLDMVLTVQNYHDLHLKPFPADNAAKMNAEIYRALKPGGVYLVVDHVGLAGVDIDKLHRIDPAQIKTEVQAAGFRLAGESEMLRNPADPHTDNVFNPAIRGRTDQVILKFVKPRG